MSATRRNILTMLGLASIGSAAIAADDVTNQTDCLVQAGDGSGKKYQLAKYDPERLATALERLAAEVRAKTVNIPHFNISTDVVGDDWLKQTLTIDVEVMHAGTS